MKIRKINVDGIDYLGFTVQCERWDRAGWFFKVRNELSVIPASDDNGAISVKKSYTATFEESHRNLGYSEFMAFDNLTHGYIDDQGGLTLQVDIFPINVQYGDARKHGNILYYIPLIFSPRY